mmetsp:Transcript_38694/g.76174  ORF Transcript_38694/g.76174 Transcript_38694/m.76174 type:complete len:350 (+) Transcript_38694:39-1088(+)|eukprot:CAMPEP_0175095804 /NCGR_PEP_ID=MMETSP0086_2-20121207/4371_1 /TAXON_ID=136419 /ORGANISM="Unknown Unknown, Strain D1" /LENGTH=349 /DNA_ID=CAMNT_0016369117 /DNA_START=27 /DNA_END=1076 /DNA_ORIENTATION=-
MASVESRVAAATLAEPASKKQSLAVKIFLVIALYWVVSISLVFLNKVLVSGDSLKTPFFVTWFQCVCTMVIVKVLGELSPETQMILQDTFPKQNFHFGIAKQMLPLSLVFVGMVSFNNLCLQFVDVSFYNVARSLTIVFNVILTYVLLKEKNSTPTLIALAVVVGGFLVGSKGEVNFSMVGTFFGVCSSVFVSLNSVLTKSHLKIVNDSKWKLAFYNNVNASVLFLPLIVLSGEASLLFNNISTLLTVKYQFALFMSGLFGFAIGIVTVMQIKATSPLTHNISGTAKACLQTALAFYIWGNEATVKAVLGVVMVLFGSAAYTIIKRGEMQRQKAAEEQKVKMMEMENKV